MNKPPPITAEDLSALCAVWQAHYEAERASMEHWNSLPNGFERWERFNDDPSVVAHRNAVTTAREAAAKLTGQMEGRYHPWLHFQQRIGTGVPGEKIKHFVADCYFEACRDAFGEAHKDEITAIREAITPLPLLVEPPASGYVFATTGQRAWRITRATHKGKRVWATGHDGKEVRLHPGRAARWGDSGNGYKALPEALGVRIWNLTSAFLAAMPERGDA